MALGAVSIGVGEGGSRSGPWDLRVWEVLRAGGPLTWS